MMFPEAKQSICSIINQNLREPVFVNPIKKIYLSFCGITLFGIFCHVIQIEIVCHSVCKLLTNTNIFICMCFTNVNEAGIRYRYFMYSPNKCTDFNTNITN